MEEEFCFRISQVSFYLATRPDHATISLAHCVLTGITLALHGSMDLGLVFVSLCGSQVSSCKVWRGLKAPWLCMNSLICSVQGRRKVRFCKSCGSTTPSLGSQTCPGLASITYRSLNTSQSPWHVCEIRNGIRGYATSQPTRLASMTMHKTRAFPCQPMSHAKVQVSEAINLQVSHRTNQCPA